MIVFYSPLQYRERSEVWQNISRSSSASVEQVKTYFRSLLQNEDVVENLISNINLEKTPVITFAQFLRCSDPELGKAVSLSQSRRVQSPTQFRAEQNPHSQARNQTFSGSKHQSRDKRGVTSPLKVTFRAQENQYQSPPKIPGVKIEIVKPAIPLGGPQNQIGDHF